MQLACFLGCSTLQCKFIEYNSTVYHTVDSKLLLLTCKLSYCSASHRRSAKKMYTKHAASLLPENLIQQSLHLALLAHRPTMPVNSSVCKQSLIADMTTFKTTTKSLFSIFFCTGRNYSTLDKVCCRLHS